jgi:hypothetical protein
LICIRTEAAHRGSSHETRTLPDKDDPASLRRNIFLSMTSYVMSRSMPVGERGGVLFTEQSPAALVAEIRKHRGRDIWLMGGVNSRVIS